MSFRLLIECTKDISELHINFSDGTSIVKEAKSEKKISEKNDKPKKNNSQYLDTESEDSSSYKSEIIEKPVISDKDRPIKVATELQNLDI